MLCTWSIFPFFPVIPACDGEDKEIWSLKRFLMSSFLNSVVKHALFCMIWPTPMLFSHLLYRFSLSELPLCCGQRPFLSGLRLRRGVWGSVSVCLVCPPSTACSAHTSLHQCHLSRGTVCMMSHSPASPFSDFFFSPLSPVKLLSALHTGFKWLCRKAQMGPSHSVLPEASGVMFAFSICIYWFQAFSIKMFLLFGMPVAAFIKYFKYLKGLILFCFALLCFTALPGMDMKFRVEFPSEFCMGWRQTRCTDETTLTRTVTVTGSPSGTGVGGWLHSLLTRRVVLKASYTSSQEKEIRIPAFAINER